MQESHRHLKMEFKDELSVASGVSRHCTTWALSDTKQLEFSANCDHQHDLFCAGVIVIKYF
jgi:hypothetical protein